MAEAEAAIENLCSAKEPYLLECNVWRNESTL